MDGPSAQGFLGLTAFQAEGCGIALTGDEHKVSVTGFTFGVTWHNKHYVDQPPPVAFPLWCLTAPPFPRCIGRTTKGKRLYGQARRLTSPDLHILCRMCTVDNKALKSSLLIIDSIMPLHRGWQRNWIHRREKRPTNQVPLPPQGNARTLRDLPSRLQW